MIEHYHKLRHFAAGCTFVVLPGASCLLLIPEARLFFKANPRPLWLYGSALSLAVWLLPLLTKANSLAVLANEVGQAGLLLLTAMAFTQLGYSQPRSISAFMHGVQVSLWLIAAISLLMHFTVGGRIAGWSHPNIWAFQLLIPVVLLSVSTLKPPRLIGALASAYLVIFLTGSRTALLALTLTLVLKIVFEMVKRRRTAREKLVVIALGVMILACVSLLNPRLRTTVLEFYTFSRNETPINLSGPGQALGIDVKTLEATEPDQPTLLLTKVGDASWFRLQHQVILFPGEIYTLQLSLSSEELASQPGLLGTGRTPGEALTRLNVVKKNGIWQVESSQDIEINDFSYYSSSVSEKLTLSFKYVGSKPVRWWVGATPNQLSKPNSKIMVSPLIFVKGETTLGAKSLSLAAVQAQSRFADFTVAIKGFKRKPWFGNAINSFSGEYRLHPPTQNVAINTHAHNLLFNLLFEKGVTGTLGLLSAVVLLSWRATRHNPINIFFILLLVFANTFDMPFWSAGMAYTFVASINLVAARNRSARDYLSNPMD